MNTKKWIAVFLSFVMMMAQLTPAAALTEDEVLSDGGEELYSGSVYEDQEKSGPVGVVQGDGTGDNDSKSTEDGERVSAEEQGKKSAEGSITEDTETSSQKENEEYSGDDFLSGTRGIPLVGDGEATLIAEVNGIKYTSLSEAINSVPQNGSEPTTITLLEDIIYDENNSNDNSANVYVDGKRNINLDLNNHIFVSRVFYITDNSIMNIDGTRGSATLNSAIVTGASSTGSRLIMNSVNINDLSVEPYGEAIITCTGLEQISNSTKAPITVAGGGVWARLTIKGAPNIIGSPYGINLIKGTCNIEASGGNIDTIRVGSGGTLNVVPPNGYQGPSIHPTTSGYGLEVEANGVANISGGLIYGTEAHIRNAGTLSITAGSIGANTSGSTSWSAFTGYEATTGIINTGSLTVSGTSVVIRGETYAVSNSGTASITGGKYYPSVQDLLSSEYTEIDNTTGDTTYKEIKHLCVARINDTPYTTLSAAIEAATQATANSVTINLIDDVTLVEPLTINNLSKTIILNMGNHIISAADNSSSIIMNSNNGSLMLKYGTINCGLIANSGFISISNGVSLDNLVGDYAIDTTGNSQITVGSGIIIQGKKGGIHIDKNSQVNINSSTVVIKSRAESESDNYGLVVDHGYCTVNNTCTINGAYVGSKGRLEISRGYLYSSSDLSGNALSDHAVEVNGGTCNITNTPTVQGIHVQSGTLNISGGYLADTDPYGVVIEEAGNATISGGNLQSTDASISSIVTNAGSLTMTGGSIGNGTNFTAYGISNTGSLTISNGSSIPTVIGSNSAINNSGTINITGGRYSSDVNSLLKPEYYAVLGNDNLYEVKQISDIYTAKVGSKPYETLYAACDAANDGETIFVLKDVMLESNHSLSITKPNITLDLYGKTIAGNVSINNSEASLILQDSSVQKTGKIELFDSSSAPITVYEGSLTINSGKIVGDIGIRVGTNGNVTVNDGDIIWNEGNGIFALGGTVLIAGGRFTRYGSGSSNQAVYTESSVRVTGGYFEGGFSTGEIAGSFEVSGGRYSVAPEAQYIAEGFKIGEQEESTGLYPVVEKTKYTITWNNDDGSLIDTTTVYEGLMPTHDDIEKAATKQYTYTFAGWSPTIVAATENATYNATYDSTVNKYTITWEDGNGETLNTEQVEYGKTPLYTGATPTKTATEQYTYTFSNSWSPSIVSVTGDATYTAQFTSDTRQYSVIFNSNEGTEIPEQKVAYDGKVKKPDDPTKDGASFAGWYKDESLETAWDFDNDGVKEDITLYAKWTTLETATVGKSLELNDSIRIRVQIRNLSHEDHLEYYHLNAVFNGITTIDGTLKDLMNSGQVVYSGERYRAVVAAALAPQIIDKVHITFSYVENQHNPIIISEFDYSVQQYCENMIQKAANDKLTALCKATLDYGAYAQKAFNYKTDNLANINYSAGASLIENTVIGETYNKSQTIDTCTGIISTGKTLNLQSATELRIKFRPVDINTFSDYTFSVDGHPVTAVVEDGRFVVKIPEIKAPDLDHEYEVAITHKDGSSMRVVYSPMAYCYNMQKSGDNATALLTKAFYLYHIAAKNYFG